MGEMSKVEEVARAMWSQRVKFAAEQGIDLSDKDIDRMLVSNGVLEEAKAAIEALRVPTERMIDMGCAAKVDLYPAYEGEKPQPTGGDVASASYQAMIDAALKE